MQVLEENVNFIMPQVAAGSNASLYSLWHPSRPGRVTAAVFIPSANLTANDTNFTDLSVQIGSTEIASEQTTTGDTGDLTAGTALTLALSGDLDVDAGEQLICKKTDSGSGVAAQGTFVLTIRYDRNGVG